jgi:glycosyltransferase involved in cell wall biosynthesis
MDTNFDKPLVTIITSVLNGEKYIEQTLLSVFEQTYSNIEYIVIDGGSSDDTVSILKKYNNKIFYWISEPDLGIYDAWNKGLAIANGDWIGFLGAGDLYTKEAISNYVKTINLYDNLDYISSKICLVDDDLKVKRIVGKSWNWKDFQRYMNVAHVGSLHSKKLFQRLGYYDINYKIVGDYELLLRAKDNLVSAFIEINTVLMRVGGVSDNMKVHKETFNAKVNTGDVNLFKAFFDKSIAIIIFYLRKNFLQN